MAAYSSISAWRISWAEEPGGLQSRGLQRVGHDLSDLEWKARLEVGMQEWKAFENRGFVVVWSHVWLFCDCMDCSLPGSFAYGIFQARILKWVAISFSRGSSCIVSPALVAGFFTTDPPGKPNVYICWSNYNNIDMSRWLKESACSVGDRVQSLSWEEGNGNPLQYSCLVNPHGLRSLAGGCKESDMTEWQRYYYLLNGVWRSMEDFETMNRVRIVLS